ncbi:MAG: choice-of-anchor D domain-containing protein [Deltaproteobacteria bacterium]|nr:choice-of-anchor D domain-containing protein [Deltaproteobacteria bacterium]
MRKTSVSGKLSGSTTIKAALAIAASLLAVFFACDREPPLGPGEARLTISGKITLNNSPADSVDVSLAGEREASTLTDSSGNYAFGELGNGLYAIKPASSGFVFSPAHIEVRLSGEDLTDQNFTMLRAAPLIVVQKETIDFGTVDVGTAREVELGVGNLGLTQLTISQLAFSNSVFSGPTEDLVVPPDSLVYVTINFKPTSTALTTGDLTITSDDPSTPSKTINLSGKGIVRGTAQITATPQNLSFGFVKVGSSSLSKLTLANQGNELLHITSVTTTNSEFLYAIPSMAIAAGRSIEMSVSFAPSDTGGKAAQLIVNSDAANSPELRVSLSGTGISVLPSSIKVDPEEIDFGNVFLDSLAERDLTIDNTGTDSLIVTAFRISGPGFSTTFGEGIIIPPQGSKTYKIRFLGTNVGEKAGSLTIYNSDPQSIELNVPLKAVAIYAPPQEIRLEPSLLEFGQVDIGSSSQQGFWVINPTTVPLEVQSVSSSNTSFSVETEALTVSAGDSSLIDVTFAPTAEGAVEGAITLNTNVSGGKQVSVDVSGLGFLPAAGKLELSTDRLDFGTVVVGQSISLTVELRNTGEGNVIVSSASTDDPAFTASMETDKIAPESSADIQVAFAPQHMGVIGGSLVIESNDPELPTATVSLSGAGVDTTGNEPLMTVSSRLIEIGEVMQLLTGSRALTIGNIGKDTLHVTDIKASRNEFEANPKSFEVPPGLTQDITVYFTPFEPGEILGLLIIHSDDQALPVDTLQVVGTGIEGGGGLTERDILIPGGVFLMGKTGEFEPVRQVKISSFYIDKYEVTNQEYKLFIDAGGYNRPDLWTPEGWEWRMTSKLENFNPSDPKPRYWGTGDAPWESDPYSNQPETPVVGVNWYEASAYAKFRNRSLPTEAQWEFAARGTTGRTYPWGNLWFNTFTNHGQSRSPYYDESDGFKFTAPIGNYLEGATPEGIHHMAGNVWEWCKDWFGAYNTNETINPQGPSNGLEKVVRGGSWNGSVLFSRSFHRNRSQPHRRYKDGGIRLVKSF